MAGQGLK